MLDQSPNFPVSQFPHPHYLTNPSGTSRRVSL
jgi:hypothetical protein